MGLDVTAVGAFEMAPALAVDEDGGIADAPDFSWTEAYANPEFPGRADSLPAKFLYRSDETEHTVHVGYSIHSYWRDWLAKTAGYPAAEPDGIDDSYTRMFPHTTAAWRGHVGPFYELLNFSDCEGVIGPDTSAKLAVEFAEWEERIMATPNDVAPRFDFHKLYRGWKRSFEIAAGKGFVHFH